MWIQELEKPLADDHTVLYYTYYTILHYIVSFYTILYCTTLYYTILHYIILYNTKPYYIVLYYTTLYLIVLHYTILHYITLYHTILRYTIVHYTTLYYTILHNPILYYWRRQWHPTPVLLPGKSHGQRSLVGCSPLGHEELDTTEWLHSHFSLSCIGEGNGNPLQCSCLENPGDGGAWWAAVHGVTKSWIWLKWLSSSSSSILYYITHTIVCGVCFVAQSCLTLCNPMDCNLPCSSVHGIFSGKNAGVACHFLLQGIYLTQESNLHLLRCISCRWILYLRSHWGSPIYTEYTVLYYI